MNTEKLGHTTPTIGLWERWKKFGKRIGDFQARALLSIFYFIILAPFALIIQRVSDPLAIKTETSGGWQVKGEGEGSPRERASRQF
jgi:hypothetical protein